MKVLLIEDDTTLAASLSDYLGPEGFEVHHSLDAEIDEAMLSSCDIVILDWMLPGTSGVDLLRSWRQKGRRIPVILLTAKSDLIDRVLGLELGANDYITKPFEPRELLARLRVQQRLLRPSEPTESVLACGLLEMNTSSRTVKYVEQVVELNRQEYALLELLMRNPNRVFSREEILTRAWSYNCAPTTRTVDTHVLQVRQKTSPDIIETVRGIGYRLRCPEQLTDK